MTTLSETFSVCPACLKRIRAAYVKKGDSVYLEKQCEAHGMFSCLVSAYASDYENWRANTVNVKPKEILRRSEKGCPHDCGPCENHLQTACCVLIDVTDRCDQNCAVCFASASPDKKKEPNISEIRQKYEELIRMSEARKFNIQISGGEPTVRDDLPEIVKMAKDMGFEYVQLNTNGKKIGADEEYAHTLKQAGVDAVFMQFDGMDDAVYLNLRNEELLETKKKAVENCRKARIPVALVPTIVRGVNDLEIGGIIKYMLENTDVVKGIHFQPVSFIGKYPGGFGDEQRFTMFDTINEIELQTDGAISKDDLLPISTGHPLCCFYATFLKQDDGSISCTSAGKRNSDCGDEASCGDGDESCCDEDESCGNGDETCCDGNGSCGDEGESCCGGGETCCGESESGEEEPCCPPDIEIITKDRDYVLNKWKMAGDVSEDGFDAFLNKIRENNFTLTGMAFQDAASLDTERLRRCRVQVLGDNGNLIPFCAYNLTDLSGKYLRRTSSR